jgi:DNA-binding response OmpR family regulator
VTSSGREACLLAGMDDFIGKPFTRASLHAVLSRWLDKHNEDGVTAPHARVTNIANESAG